MNCVKCGGEIPDSAKFCTKCGAKQEAVRKSRFCTKCGAEMGASAKFCTKCGAKAEPRKCQFCTKCGEELDASATVCTKCGARIGGGGIRAAVSASATRMSPPHSEPPPAAEPVPLKNDPKAMLWFAGLAVGAIIGAPILAWLVVSCAGCYPAAAALGFVYPALLFAAFVFACLKPIAWPGLASAALVLVATVAVCAGWGTESEEVLLYCGMAATAMLAVAVAKMWHLVPKWTIGLAMLGLALLLWREWGFIAGHDAVEATKDSWLLSNYEKARSLRNVREVMQDFAEGTAWIGYVYPVLTAIPFVAILFKRGKIDLSAQAAALVPHTGLCLNDPARMLSFNGRIRRASYWGMIGIEGGLFVVCGILLAMAATDRETVATVGLIAAVYVICTVITVCSWPCIIRRWHDFNCSGWIGVVLAVLGAIPLVGWIVEFVVFIVLGCVDSNVGYNAYGPDPKETERTARVVAF